MPLTKKDINSIFAAFHFPAASTNGLKNVLITTFFYNYKNFVGAGEITQRLRALATLAKDSSGNSQPPGPLVPRHLTPFSGFQSTRHTHCAHMHKLIHMQANAKPHQVKINCENKYYF